MYSIQLFLDENRNLNEFGFIFHNIPTEHGSSGGPVLLCPYDLIAIHLGSDRSDRTIKCARDILLVRDSFMQHLNTQPHQRGNLLNVFFDFDD